MVTSLIGGSALLAMLSACGPSVAQACQDFGNAYCERIYACATGAQLAVIQAEYGPTVDTCKQTEQTTNNCAGAQSTCPAGTSYDTNAAETCVSNLRAASCSDITNPRYVVPGCSLSDVCR